MKVLSKTRWPDIVYCALAGFISIALVLLYRAADDEAFAVLLWPHAKAVEVFFAMRLGYVPQTGYCAPGSAFAIGPDCLGIYFIVMMFCMLIFSFTHRFKGFRKTVWLLLSLVISVVVGIAVSCIRIIGSVPVISSAKFATLHTIIGAVLYFVALIGVYIATKKILGGKCDGEVW